MRGVIVRSTPEATRPVAMIAPPETRASREGERRSRPSARVPLSSATGPTDHSRLLQPQPPRPRAPSCRVPSRDRRSPPPRGGPRRRGRVPRARRPSSGRAPRERRPGRAEPRAPPPPRRPSSPRSHREPRRPTPSTKLSARSSRSASSSCCASTARRAPAYVREVLQQGLGLRRDPVQDNITDPAQLKRLTQPAQAGAAEAHADHLHRPGGRRDPQRRLGAARSNAQANQVPGQRREAAAQALQAAGINVTPRAGRRRAERRRRRDGLARVLPRPGSRRPARPRRRSSGWRAGGVAPTAKHFPGLGGATVNTDRGTTTIPQARQLAADLAPFKAAIAAEVPLIMSSHAALPAARRATASPRQSPRDPRRRCCATSCTTRAS